MSASLPFFAIPLVGTEDTSDSADCAGEQLEPGFGSGPDTRRFLDSGELDINAGSPGRAAANSSRSRSQARPPPSSFSASSCRLGQLGSLSPSPSPTAVVVVFPATLLHPSSRHKMAAAEPKAGTKP